MADGREFKHLVFQTVLDHPTKVSKPDTTQKGALRPVLKIGWVIHVHCLEIVCGFPGSVRRRMGSFQILGPSFGWLAYAAFGPYSQ